MRKGLTVNLKDYIKVDNAPASLLSSGLCFLCAGPGRARETICLDCLNDLIFNSGACPACAKPTVNAGICADCLGRSDNPNHSWAFVNKTRTLFQYRYPVNRLIQHMKFKQGLDIANFLGSLLGKSFFSDNTALPDCVIPVPLHPSRLIYRGYNQSVELARPLSKQLNIKLDTLSCRRVRATLPQTDLPPKKRKRNVRNAFSVPEKIPYTHVLLVDDVITSGSTVNELARTLRRAGVDKIDVIACARAGLSLTT